MLTDTESVPGTPIKDLLQNKQTNDQPNKHTKKNRGHTIIRKRQNLQDKNILKNI